MAKRREQLTRILENLVLQKRDAKAKLDGIVASDVADAINGKPEFKNRTAYAKARYEWTVLDLAVNQLQMQIERIDGTDT